MDFVLQISHFMLAFLLVCRIFPQGFYRLTEILLPNFTKCLHANPYLVFIITHQTEGFLNLELYDADFSNHHLQF